MFELGREELRQLFLHVLAAIAEMHGRGKYLARLLRPTAARRESRRAASGSTGRGAIPVCFSQQCRRISALTSVGNAACNRAPCPAIPARGRARPSPGSTAGRWPVLHPARYLPVGGRRKHDVKTQFLEIRAPEREAVVDRTSCAECPSRAACRWRAASYFQQQLFAPLHQVFDHRLCGRSSRACGTCRSTCRPSRLRSPSILNSFMSQ